MSASEPESPARGETIERLAPSYPVNVVVAVLGYAPCEKCGGPHVVTLDVGATGYSCGSSYVHTPECAALRCSHGVLWNEDCSSCEAAADSARAESGSDEIGDDD